MSLMIRSVKKQTIMRYPHACIDDYYQKIKGIHMSQYMIFIFLSLWLHLVSQSLGSSTSLQLTQCFVFLCPSPNEKVFYF